MRRTTFFVAVVAAVLGAKVACADSLGTVDLQLASTPSNSPYSYTMYWNSGSYSGRAGPYQANLSNSNPASLIGGLPATIGLYCMELNENISVGPTYTYDVRPADEAPVPGTANVPAMGADRAKVLAYWYKSYADSVVDRATEIAFQLGVWEIVHERKAGDASLTTYYSLSDGTAYATGATVVAIANQWFTDLTIAGKANALYALTYDGRQDFLIDSGRPEFPGPSALVGLMGMGLIGLVARRRRCR